MAKPPRIFYTEALADNATVAGVEEVVATLNGVRTTSPGGQVRFVGNVLATGGAGTTTLTVRVREDSLTGTLVGEAAVVDITGAITADATVVAEHSPGEVAGKVYVLTAAIAGAAGTVNAATLQAFAT